MRRSLLAAAVAVLTTACASSPRAPDAPVLIEVDNNHSLMVNVEAVDDTGQDFRLGAVETANVETFELPAAVSPWNLRLRVDPVGSTQVYTTERVDAAPGAVLDLDVEGNLALSSLTVR